MEIRNLCKTYGEKKVLSSFCADFQPGKRYALMGPSGIGKTTLVRLILGLEKPDSGDMTGVPAKMSAAIMRGSRICMMILRCIRSSPPPSRICQISDAESETLPARRFQIRKTARRTNSSEKPRYVRFARFRSMFVPPLVKFQSCQHRFPVREAIRHCSFVKNRSGASAPFKTVWRSTTRSLRSSDS